ncbi:unnamed protein product [Toxocara canis]|uniref:Na+-dependent transporters of the SNF family n=1 Tax=Toxocara canis TaxID=6265 RepID=A0A183UFT5_TOXCA|nr:unnamed protein product [Toxocara canis]
MKSIECLFPGVYTPAIIVYFFVFGNISGMMTVLPMAIERACSTIKADQYEEKSIRLGLMLAIISILVGLGNASLFIVGINMPGIGLVVEGGLVIGEFIIIGIFIALYAYYVRWRKSKARTVATLSHKYQVEENIESILNLLPLASANVLCNLVSAVCIMLSFIDPLNDLPKAYFDITPLYFIALPIIRFWRRRAARRWKESRAKQNQVKSNKETSGHFQILRSLFNTEAVHETDDGHF